MTIDRRGNVSHQAFSLENKSICVCLSLRTLNKRPLTNLYLKLFSPLFEFDCAENKIFHLYVRLIACLQKMKGPAAEGKICTGVRKGAAVPLVLSGTMKPQVMGINIAKIKYCSAQT